MNETYQLEIEPVVKETLGTLEQTGRSFKVTFDTFIYVDDCSCDGLTTYTRICQSHEDCNGTIVRNTTCQIGKECRTSTDFTYYAIGAGVLLLITIVLLSFVIKIYCCNRSGKSDANMEQDYLFVDPVFQNYEIPSQTDVIWDERKPIGNGRFGMVYSCPLKQENGLHIVAIKTPLDTASAAEKMDFKKEIQLMAQIGKHINIIELIGCRTAKDPMYIITPLMQYGCLLELLRKSATMQQKGVFTDEIYDLRLKDLFSISRQIAKGMEYISSLRIVHGDLAARNVLIGKGLLVKIGDFGLGQDTYEKGYLRLKDGEVPVKWYSLETLLEHYMTPMSDVWSFGILLYEIFTFGKSPYPGIIIGTLPQLLQRGYRMHRPEHCPSTAYKIMTSCWHELPKKRPTFKMLYHQFDTVLEFVTNDSNLYLKLSEKGKNEEEDTMPEIMKNKKSEIDNYELRILESRQKYSISEETYDEESTGQTFNVVEYTPFMETSSQFGGKSCGVDSQLPHYNFTSEGTRFNSMEDVTFIPIFEDSGNGEAF
ncbi:fibroblast growth factor receptor 1-A-like [Antedon mediterranea]|uniref:fibroblast growth factor receptor 1-A-like n=1 Tax=Antedon mediterranea TaxID=105859 RepID=UPI003AF438B8